MPKTDPNSTTTRSDQTIAALMEAGITLFGEKGFNATSTRDLCAASGANISAINYHFGGKDGLYAAVIRHIGESLHGQVEAHLPFDVSELDLSQPMPGAQAMQLLKQAMAAFATALIANSEASRWSKLIVREQTSPGAAFEILYTNHIALMQRVLNYFISSITGEQPDDISVKIRSHALLGQVLGFVVSRESILRALGCQQFSDEHRQLIVDMIVDHIQSCVHQTKPIETTHAD